MYRVDETRRLADAQAAALKPPGAYLEPGIVWWAFDPGSASRRGARDASPVDTMAFDPGLGSGRSAPDAVVHLAGDAASHLDVYFRVLEDRRFDVAEAGLRVQAQGELLVIATVADLRPVDRSLRDRAVICQLRLPRRDEMVAQARSVTGLDDGLIAAVVDRVIAAQDALGHIGGIQPRTVLDVLRAVQALGIDPATDGPDWPALLDALMPG